MALLLYRELDRDSTAGRHEYGKTYMQTASLLQTRVGLQPLAWMTWEFHNGQGFIMCSSQCH